MEKCQRPCHKSVTQSASGHSSERGDINGAHARRFPQICLFQIQTLFPILTMREGVHLWSHSVTKNNQNNGEDINKTTKKPSA